MGDILLFEGGDDPLDQAIMFLTRSRVSHAALCCGDGILVDAGLSGVGAHPFRSDPSGRRVFVRRPRAELDIDSVVDVAVRYVSEVDPYEKPGLALLAPLILHERLSPSDATQRIMAWVIDRTVEYLEKWIGGDSSSPARVPMACSQFLLRCFHESSASHRLEIRRASVDGVVANAPSCLVDRLADRPVPLDFASRRPGLDPQAHVLSDDVLVGMLMESLRADVGNASERDPSPVREDLAQSVYALARLMHLAIRGKPAPPGCPIRFLVERKASYVTPGDLLDRCPSLQDMGKRVLRREGCNTGFPGR
jgi:hypothetical protein